MSVSRGIRILIVQSDDMTREGLAAIIDAAEDMEVVGAVRTGDAAIALARKLEPDIVLVDYNLQGKDGIETTEALAALLPRSGVILLSTDMSADVLRRAMVVGAREFLQLPPNPEEMVRVIYQVYDTTLARRTIKGEPEAAPMGRTDGQTIAIFSPKGGVGCTTLATNLAIAIRQEAGLRVALIDGSLPFGDVGVFLDLPTSQSIMDLQMPAEQIDPSVVERALLTHDRSGVKVLLAPPRPELADMVTGELVRRSITLLRERHDYVIIDTWSMLDERVLTMLETVDTILLVLSLELSTIKSAKIFLEVADLLQFPTTKIKLVMMRANAATGVTVGDIESTLGRPIDSRIPHDDRIARSINEGTPVMLSAHNSPVAQAIADLARHLVAESYPAVHPSAVESSSPAVRGGRFRLFARG